MKKIIGMIILYLLSFVIIVVAVFCGIRLYKEIKAESYINGSIDISNRFTQESFNYSSTSVVFYHDLYDDTDTYAFEKDLLKVENFDGKKKTYQVVLNDYVLLNTEINAGSVFATVDMDFYDTNGNVINMDDKIKIDLSITEEQPEIKKNSQARRSEERRVGKEC